MKIHFKKLQREHFPKLLKWLETPHVKAWWDEEMNWNNELIEEKYGPYVDGYKMENGQPKKIQAYIICADEQEVGYIQSYNVYDFPRSEPLEGFPDSLAGIDMFIGEKEFLEKGVATTAISQFLQKYVHPYFESCFVDPNIYNEVAIRTYEKAGFQQKVINDPSREIWMLRTRPFNAI